MPETMLPGSLLAMTGQTADRLIQLTAATPPCCICTCCAGGTCAA